MTVGTEIEAPEVLFKKIELKKEEKPAPVKKKKEKKLRKRKKLKFLELFSSMTL